MELFAFLGAKLAQVDLSAFVDNERPTACATETVLSRNSRHDTTPYRLLLGRTVERRQVT